MHGQQKRAVSPEEMCGDQDIYMDIVASFVVFIVQVIIIMAMQVINPLL